MCLAEFAATYVTNYCCDDHDVLPPTEPEATFSQITLTGEMNKRRREAIIRFNVTIKIVSLVICIEPS